VVWNLGWSLAGIHGERYAIDEQENLCGIPVSSWLTSFAAK
jgi:hypothetical protein